MRTGRPKKDIHFPLVQKWIEGEGLTLRAAADRLESETGLRVAHTTLGRRKRILENKRREELIPLPLHDRLIAEIIKKPPLFLEHLVAQLMREMGYECTLTPVSRDGGFDGVVKLDPLGFQRVLIEVKRFALDKPVTRRHLQLFRGAMIGEGALGGIFITTSRLTSGASAFVFKQSPSIVVFDGLKLAKALIEYGVGVTNTGNTPTIDPSFWEDKS